MRVEGPLFASLPYSSLIKCMFILNFLYFPSIPSHFHNSPSFSCLLTPLFPRLLTSTSLSLLIFLSPFLFPLLSVYLLSSICLLSLNIIVSSFCLIL